MKAKYQIYKATLHSGEIYIGQRKGNVLIDGYIGSPKGKNGCNFYTLEDIARIEVLDFANTKKDIDKLEAKYIDYYRKTFGVSPRIIKEYEWLLKYFKPGVCLNISGGGTHMNCNGKQKYKDFFKDKLIVQCDINWNLLELFDCLDDVMYKTKASNTSAFYRCFNKKAWSAYSSRWLLVTKNKISDLESIILDNKKEYEDRRNNICKKNMVETDVYTVDGIYIGRFNSISEAGSKLNIQPGLISKCIAGKCNSTHGYVFKSVGEYKNRRLVVNNVNQYDENYNYIATYVSIAAAARSIPNANATGIQKCCNGLLKTAYGYIWEFAKNNKISPHIMFDMFDTNLNYLETFNSVGDIIKRFGTSANTNIHRCCRGEQVLLRGYIFRYHDPTLANKYEKRCAELYLKYIEKQKNRMINLYDKYHDFVGLFDTATSVAKYIGLKSSDNVLRCCNGKQKTTMGYYCEYANK